ncbi:MAG: GHMP family kinase ATP-binding protein [Promethearchaeota archaeon]
MLEAIKNFLLSLNPDIVIQAPSRINIINPLDAVEGDFWMPSVAINGVENPLSVFLYIKEIEGESRLKVYTVKKLMDQYSFIVKSEEILSKSKNEVKAKLNGQNKLIYASINRFKKMYSYFESSFLNINIEIGFLTTIPEKSGLGGSASIIVALLYGLTQFFKLNNNFNILREIEFPINKDIIAEMATKIEDEDLSITGGYADNYVISRGGLCFCSYYGKLHHKEISEEPLAIYDRIDEVYELNNIPIVVCFSGIQHESGDVHGKLRSLYLQGNPLLLSSYKELAEIAWKSRFSLMRCDWAQLGNFFKENTRIMNRVMQEAGFKHGIGAANNILIRLIEEHPDVFAAKLTGAGGGGSVFALVNPNKIETVLNYWQERINELHVNKDVFTSIFPLYPAKIINKLQNAQFFQIEIDKTGVKKLFLEES